MFFANNLHGEGLCLYQINIMYKFTSPITYRYCKCVICLEKQPWCAMYFHQYCFLSCPFLQCFLYMSWFNFFSGAQQSEKSLNDFNKAEVIPNWPCQLLLSLRFKHAFLGWKQPRQQHTAHTIPESVNFMVELLSYVQKFLHDLVPYLTRVKKISVKILYM